MALGEIQFGIRLSVGVTLTIVENEPLSNWRTNQTARRFPVQMLVKNLEGSLAVVGQ